MSHFSASMPTMSALASSRAEKVPPIASRMSTWRPSRRAKAGPSPCEISCITTAARYPSAEARRACAGSITRAASGRMTSFTRASMKFLKKIFFVPFSW